MRHKIHKKKLTIEFYIRTLPIFYPLYYHFSLFNLNLTNLKIATPIKNLLFRILSIIDLFHTNLKFSDRFPGSNIDGRQYPQIAISQTTVSLCLSNIALVYFEMTSYVDFNSSHLSSTSRSTGATLYEDGLTLGRSVTSSIL